MDDTANGARTGRLPHLGLLRFTGADAASFLQGQVSADTRRIAAGAALLCALSGAQGRVLAVMTLVPHASGLLAILPRALLEPIAATLRRFVLRSKVRIEAAPAELLVGAALGDAPPATHDSCLARLRDPHPRYWVIGAPARSARTTWKSPGVSPTSAPDCRRYTQRTATSSSRRC